MRINNINNTNFKGYENLVSNSVVDEQNNFAYMSMRLNNDKVNDLDTWRDIQRNLLQRKDISDKLFISNYNLEGNNLFSIDDFTLIPEMAKNRREESYILKAYDLMASLTRRIFNTDLHVENRDIYLSLVHAHKNLLNLISNEGVAYQLATGGALKVVKHHKTAELINSNIVKEMTRYLKL